MSAPGWNPNPQLIREEKVGCVRPGCLLKLLVLVLLGIGGWAFRQPIEAQIAEWRSQITGQPKGQSIFGPSLSLVSAPAALAEDANNDKVPDLLVQSFDNPGFVIAAVDGATGNVLWQTTPPASQLPELVTAGKTVLAINEQTVRAYRLGDGGLIWERSLPDKLITYPRPAVFVDGDRLVFHSSDNTLTALEAASGARLWERTLAERSPDQMRRIGERICATERDEDGRDVLQCYSLSSGEPAEQVALAFEWHNTVFWWPAAGPEPAFYRLLTTHDQTTFDLLKLADGGQVWGQAVDSSFGTIIEHQLALAAGGAAVALAIEDHMLLRTSGEILTVREPETELFPLAFDGNLLYAAAVRQRGTRTLSILGIDPRSARVLWRSEPLGEYSGGAREMDPERWAVVPGAGLLLGWEDPGDDDLVHLTMLGQDGKVRWTYQARPFIAEDPTVLVTPQHVFVTVSDELAALDPATGQVKWEIK